MFQPDRVFLSTPSARRATSAGAVSGAVGAISIHALCEEGDRRGTGERAGRNIFLSTPSARRATQIAEAEANLDAISIHALCEEGDSMLMPSAAATAYFYPRPLRGGRPWKRSAK